MEGASILEATIKGDLETVVLLLDTGGATVDAHNTRRETPMYWACARGDLDLTRVLALYGASVNFRSVAGLTPLHAAADRGHHQCSELLLKNGADQNARTAEWRTPLHLAAYRGNTAVTRVLLRHGAHHNVTDKDGKTPVDVAACQGHWDAARLLLNHRGPLSVSGGSQHQHPDTDAPSGEQRLNLNRQRSSSVDISLRHKTPCLQDVGRRRSDDQIQLRSRTALQAESSAVSNRGTQQGKPLIGECKCRGRQRKPSLGVICQGTQRKQKLLTPEVMLESIGVNLPANSSVVSDVGTEEIKHLLGEYESIYDVDEDGYVMNLVTCLLQGLYQLGRHSERLEKDVQEWRQKALAAETENEALKQTLTEMLLSPSNLH